MVCFTVIKINTCIIQWNCVRLFFYNKNHINSSHSQWIVCAIHNRWYILIIIDKQRVLAPIRWPIYDIRIVGNCIPIPTTIFYLTHHSLIRVFIVRVLFSFYFLMKNETKRKIHMKKKRRQMKLSTWVGYCMHVFALGVTYVNIAYDV